MATYVCQTPGCGLQTSTKPPSGYACPNCGAVDSYLPMGNQASGDNSRIALINRENPWPKPPGKKE